MRRLPLVLLVLALPAAAQDDAADAGAAPVVLDQLPLDADAGTASPVDAGAPEVRPVAGNGRHFAFVWDAKGPAKGDTDVQAWVTPRWGRATSYMAVDLRIGVLQGFWNRFSLGAFIDATPTARGTTQEPSIDGKVTLLAHASTNIAGIVHLGGQVSGSAGLDAVAGKLLAIADADVGPVRLGLNADLWGEHRWSGTNTANLRTSQSLGIGYILSNGFSVGLEMVNRLSWSEGTFNGMAFNIGPAVSYRTSSFWCAITLLPQVAAVKPDARRGIGDPLELFDNERFSLRVSLGILSR